MRVTDESTWQAQVAELVASGEIGQAFLQFLEVWVEEAEELMSSRMVSGDPMFSWVAIREALPLAEEKLGRHGTVYLGQMLVLIASHWVHGASMSQGFGPIEMRLMEDVLLWKLTDLEAEAAQHGETP
jgi:hypothetical protein